MKILLSLLLAAAFCATSHAHPVPDIPVRSSFSKDGAVIVRVEIDPRCFTDDPLNEPYLRNEQFQSYSQEKKSELQERARKLIIDTIEFRMEPGGRVLPEFKVKFTTFANEGLKWNGEDPDGNSIKHSQTPVVLTAEWITDASKATGYQIKANRAGKFSVQFINYFGEEEQRLNVLFPGEESYVLDLTAKRNSTKAKPSA